MTIKDYLQVLYKRWVTVTLAVFVCLIAASATYLLQPTEYTARLSMYVSPTGAQDAASAAYGAELSLQRVKSYVILLDSRRVSEEVVQQLQLPVSPDDLTKRITVSTPADTQVIDVAVVDNSAERAASIANSIASVFPAVSAELTRDSQAGQSTTALRTVQPAPVPTSPSSTGLPVTLSLGLLAGLIVGVAAAFVQNTLDTSIRTRETLTDATGARFLGTVTYDRQHLQLPTPEGAERSPDMPRSSPEVIRKLRTSLGLDIGRRDSAKTVVVTSAGRGEGKTTLVVDLARAFVAGGLRVLLVDGDLREAALAERLGLERVPGLAEVVSGTARPTDAIQRTRNDPIDVLVAGEAVSRPSDLLNAETLGTVLGQAGKGYDIVLVDSPALEPYTDAALLTAASDGVILVCLSGVTTHSAAASAADGLRAVSASVIGTVLVVMQEPHRIRLWLQGVRRVVRVPATEQQEMTAAAHRERAESAEAEDGAASSVPAQRA